MTLKRFADFITKILWENFDDLDMLYSYREPVIEFLGKLPESERTDLVREGVMSWESLGPDEWRSFLVELDEWLEVWAKESSLDLDKIIKDAISVGEPEIQTLRYELGQCKERAMHLHEQVMNQEVEIYHLKKALNECKELYEGYLESGLDWKDPRGFADGRIWDYTTGEELEDLRLKKKTSALTWEDYKEYWQPKGFAYSDAQRFADLLDPTSANEYKEYVRKHPWVSQTEFLVQVKGWPEYKLGGTMGEFDLGKFDFNMDPDEYYPESHPRDARCPHCGETNRHVRPDFGETVCDECGETFDSWDATFGEDERREQGYDDMIDREIEQRWLDEHEGEERLAKKAEFLGDWEASGKFIIREEDHGCTHCSLEFFDENEDNFDTWRHAYMIYDKERADYELHLEDINGDEMVLYGCSIGYGGEGPHGTLEILQRTGLPLGAHNTGIIFGRERIPDKGKVNLA